MSKQAVLGFTLDREPGRSALLDASGVYRYRLTRVLGPGVKRITWIMLNPSTADASVDDATIRKVTTFSRRWSFAELTVVNLFALRSTDPRALKIHRDPVGPENDAHLLAAARGADAVVCAWGNHGVLLGRAERVGAMLAEAGVTAHCLRVSGTGQPCHPLYLPGDLQPIAWSRRESDEVRVLAGVLPQGATE